LETPMNADQEPMNAEYSNSKRTPRIGTVGMRIPGCLGIKRSGFIGVHRLLIGVHRR